MIELLITFLETSNQILTAGIAITAFSLLIYALTFNLRDRVARSFAIILACVVVVFAGEALGSTAATDFQIEFWLRFQWVGIVLLPAAYPHFSDALLETTGRPSRGRRRWLVRISYVLSLVLISLLPTDLLVGSLVPDGEPAPYLARTPLTLAFTVFYAGGLVLTWVNLWRAYRRTVLSTSRRRMQYLIAGALAPALGSFPFLLYGFQFAASHPLIFWLAAVFSNLFVTALLVIMAYAVAFFGVSWPDRVVRRRLLKWLLRGPVTASTVLALTTLVSRAERSLGINYAVVVPVIMVITVLVMEHLITLISPLWERYLFQGWEETDLELFQSIEERLLTTRDLRQFLEAVLAAVCDRLQSRSAFIAALDEKQLEFAVTVGKHEQIPTEALSESLLEESEADGDREEIFVWGAYRLLPLHGQEDESLLGILGVRYPEGRTLPDEQVDAMISLGRRAALALEDRRTQREVFTTLKELKPQVELIQRLRAAARYDQGGVLSDLDTLPAPVDLSNWVKDALSHYWGGPKLSQSPLLRLQVVQHALEEHNGNPVNALRSILKQAIEDVRPDEGERRFTAEWILYNILELKFMEGRKVREVALRLAVSEADLYRKQRVAIEAVARAIVEMERRARDEDERSNGRTGPQESASDRRDALEDGRSSQVETATDPSVDEYVREDS